MAISNTHTPSQPTVSIVTVTLNAEQHLPDLLDSIRAQHSPPHELIIIDGGSTDATVQIIEKNLDIVSYWHSKKDRGIADAMNQGVARSTGEFLLFLQSDDLLSGPDSLDIARQFISSNSDFDLYSFGIKFGSTGALRTFSGRTFGLRILFKTPFSHQSIVFRRKAFVALGDYNTTYEICMDYEWFYRAFLAKSSIIRSDKILSIMGASGLSSSTDRELLSKRFSEERRIHFQHCRGWILKQIYRLYWLLYPYYRGVSVS